MKTYSTGEPIQMGDVVEITSDTAPFAKGSRGAIVGLNPVLLTTDIMKPIRWSRVREVAATDLKLMARIPRKDSHDVLMAKAFLLQI